MVNLNLLKLVFVFIESDLSEVQWQVCPVGGAVAHLLLGVWALSRVLLLVFCDLGGGGGRGLCCFALLGSEFLPLSPGGQSLAGAAGSRSEGYRKQTNKV